MQHADALKYFLVNLGLHNLILVVLSAGLGVVLGRLLWARSAQGLVQLRERLAAEADRAKEAERRVKVEQDRFHELREQVDSAEGGTVVVNSPELEEEVATLRQHREEADATLEHMMLANAALEGAVKELEAERAAREEETSESEDDRAEVAGLRAEIEALRGEARAQEAEREALELELSRLRKEAEQGAGKPGPSVSNERVAALELELLEARNERRQVEEASAILRKELYAMRHELEELEKRQTLEKELDLALHDAEQRLSRLQAEVARSARNRPSPAADPALPEGTANEGGEEGDAPGPEAPSPAEAPSGGEADDLTRIKGIGAVLAGRLREAGVTSFAQIADWSDAEVEEIATKLSLGKRVTQGRWRRQARELACE